MLPKPKDGSERPDMATTGNHYYCFVDFATSEEAMKAMEAKNGTIMAWDGQLRVSIARNKPNTKPGREQLKENNGPIASARGRRVPFTETE